MLKVLKLCHTDVTDLKAALDIPSLQRLYISYDMVKHAENILSGGFEIIVTE